MSAIEASRGMIGDDRNRRMPRSSLPSAHPVAEATALALAVVFLLAGCGPFGEGPRPGLWVVGVDGTGAGLLVGADPVEPSEPSWSPDGRSIAYSGAQP